MPGRGGGRLLSLTDGQKETENETAEKIAMKVVEMQTKEKETVVEIAAVETERETLCKSWRRR